MADTASGTGGGRRQGSSPRVSGGQGSARPGVVRRFREWRDGRKRRRVARTTEHAQPGLADASIGEVVVTYEPCADGDPDPGEVVWAWVPYEEDKTQGKDRPVVVIGRLGAALAAVQLTTKGADHPQNVFIGAGSWDPQQRDSWAKLDRIVRIDPATVRRTDDTLDKRRFDQLADALRRHHRVVPASR